MELFRVSDGVAELTVFVEAAGEEVVEQTSAHLLELRNHRLCLRDGLVYRIQHCCDAGLLCNGSGNADGFSIDDASVQVSLCACLARRLELRSSLPQQIQQELPIQGVLKLVEDECRARRKLDPRRRVAGAAGLLEEVERPGRRGGGVDSRSRRIREHVQKGRHLTGLFLLAALLLRQDFIERRCGFRLRLRSFLPRFLLTERVTGGGRRFTFFFGAL